MSGVQCLPAGFEPLAPFVEAWALASASERAQARLASREEDRVAFFQAAQPLLAPALARLDQTPLEAFDECEKRLMRLMLSLAHVSLAVEVQGQDEARHSEDARHMRITRAPSDREA